MKKKNLSQQTAERLYNMIVVERHITAGDKLPNEVADSQYSTVCYLVKR